MEAEEKKPPSCRFFLLAAKQLPTPRFPRCCQVKTRMRGCVTDKGANIQIVNPYLYIL